MANYVQTVINCLNSNYFIVGHRRTRVFTYARAYISSCMNPSVKMTQSVTTNDRLYSNDKPSKVSQTKYTLPSLITKCDGVPINPVLFGVDYAHGS